MRLLFLQLRRFRDLGGDQPKVLAPAKVMAKQFQRTDRKFLGVGSQSAIKGFFGTNAVLSIAILLAICGFLINEAWRFFPDHHKNLKLYRLSGMEYVDHLKRQVAGHGEIDALVTQAYYAELAEVAEVEKSLIDAFGEIESIAADAGEDEIDALYEAMEALAEAEEGDDAAALAEAKQAEQDARKAWLAKLDEIVRELDRKAIDTYGRLDEDAWKTLLGSLPEWDAVNEEPPPLIVRAKETLETKMSEFEMVRDEVTYSAGPLDELKEELRASAMAVKEEALADETAEARKEALLKGVETVGDPEERARLQAEADKIVIRDEFPFDERAEQYYATQEKHQTLVKEFVEAFEVAIAKLPESPESTEALVLLDRVREAVPGYLEQVEKDRAGAEAWRHDEPFSVRASVTAFFFGRHWVTNSNWQAFYGLLPLFTGSMMISAIALVIAVPVSIGAAIYVNQIARSWEQGVVKPVIEFIQAIPSIVLAFFGIFILGDFLVDDLSKISWLSWVPGFPMEHRLNILNAGILLGLMAVPTIFTLCEDALNNVPRAFTEASLALGASKLQTIVRVLVPAAISGIFAAVLLGFGRVIGETMVVLLVAGNRIAIPDLSEGIGVLTQPAHTMTGIIAQETGEVDEGSLHWRALFMVGLILFSISLMINWTAQRIIQKFRLK